MGWAWHRAPVVYGYIAPSIDGFCTRDECTATLLRLGFAPVEVRSYLGGGVAGHVMRRT